MKLFLNDRQRFIDQVLPYFNKDNLILISEYEEPTEECQVDVSILLETASKRVDEDRLCDIYNVIFGWNCALVEDRTE